MIKGASRVIKKILRILCILLPCLCLSICSVFAYETEDGYFGLFNDNEYPIIDLTGPMLFTEHTLPNGYLYIPYFNGNEFNTYFNASSGSHTIHIDLTLPNTPKDGSLLNISLSGTSSGITSFNTTATVQLYYQDTTSSYSTLTVEKNGGNWTAKCSGIEVDGIVTHIFIDLGINTGTTGCLFEITDINISETTTGGMLSDVIDNVAQLPSNIAKSMGGLFDKVVNSVTSLGTFIIDGIKGLFIPSDDFFSTYFDNLYNFFSNKLGFLMAPFDLLIDLLTRIGSISSGDGVLSIPNIKVFDTVLINAQQFNIKQIFTETLGQYYDMYYAFVDVILILLTVNFGKKKFDEIVGGKNV